MPQAGKGYKERDNLYRLIISQLFYDGYQTLAVSLSNLLKTQPPCPPSDRLLEIVTLGLRTELEHKEHDSMRADTVNVGIGIDLEYATEAPSLAPEPALYETCYVTSHKAQCRAGAFSSDGQLVATGSHDASIKILDVDRMLAKSATPAEVTAQETAQQNMETHPVIRTLYDHIEEVTCLEFHPTEQILVSGSRDYTVKFFDYSKPSVKRAFRTIHEAEMVRCLALHPSGDFILVGTQHPVLRLYDVRTSQCFVSDQPGDQHKGPITMIKYSPNANIYATCSKDGDIKLWDGVSNRCFNTFPTAHEATEVCSLQWSRNSKYLLSSGKDSLVRLWELSMARCLIAYTGAGASGKQVHRSQAVFNHTEDYVLFPDEKTTSLCSWDARNAERQRLLSLGHNNNVRYIVHSPTGPAFVTCSDDFRARFWYRRTESGE
ncbi:cleavage stimulation factor subunit 1-like [Uloborus diversus]|uniref:cleavage stimulation factor subunit 1-like n=1 Tax=Uloborus diversus TaxID=327109 RepID=UPI0024090142|nr:cleavage stimulation factor subunit 1-like [Uloborus diversus]